MKITVLGCGHSAGTPMIGNLWGNCDPQNPKNKRTRPSVLVEVNGKRILIDTSPDLRTQFLNNNIDDIDAILFTHAHSDHVHGLNDVGIISRRDNKLIPVYAAESTMRELKKSFDYAFASDVSHYAAFLEAHTIEEAKPFKLFDLNILPIPQDHGFGPSLTYRINNFAYSTDVKCFSDVSFEKLRGLDLWVVDCLKETEHPTHSHLAQTLRWIEDIKPKHAVLTHMHPLLDYEALKAKLPPHVVPGYDGLQLSL